MPWRYATLRGTRVLVECGDDGELKHNGGRVEVRYKLGASKAYRAAARNLEALEPELLPHDACAPAAASPKGQGDKVKGSGGRRRGPVSGHDRVLPEDAIIAYTDGACSGNPGPAGLGVVIVDGDQRRETARYLGRGTNNIAELAAIGVAADALAGSERPVRIHTDSNYAIGVLTKGWKAKANQALIADIKGALAKLSDVELIYVKGHAGIPLNERADELAVSAVQARASSDWESVP